MPVYIGIDWSEDKHDVVFMNEAGVDVARMKLIIFNSARHAANRRADNVLFDMSA